MEIFRGRRLWIEKRTIRLPNSIVREKVIIHPGNAVAILPLNGDRCKMLKQYRYAIDQYIFEAPAGTMETGEDPLVTARRELIEETGFTAQTLVSKGFIYTLPLPVSNLSRAITYSLACGINLPPLHNDPVIDFRIDAVFSGKFNECLWLICFLEELLPVIKRYYGVVYCMEYPDGARGYFCKVRAWLNRSGEPNQISCIALLYSRVEYAPV